MEKRTFAEGLYAFWCDVTEEKPGMFVCAITFARNLFSGSLETTNLKLDGCFASAEIAMGVGESHGRNMIRKHGDVVEYLANKE